jgi:hypothetical protein
MDPYRILGVPRGCKPESVKAAFLARVGSAHPDSGGEDSAFIQLRAAYEEILGELDRRAQFGTNKGPTTENAPRPSDSVKGFGLVLFEQRKSPTPVDSNKAYSSLLDRISATAKPRSGKFARSLGPIFLLYILLSFPSAILMVVIALIVGLGDFDPDNGAREVLTILLVASGHACALGSACFLVLKYDLPA